MSTEQSTPLTYAQLLDELRQACVEKQTGTMMIATKDNQLARILLRDGEIVSINYRLQNGRDAVPLLKEIKQARIKFSLGKTAGGGDRGAGNLPSTAEILRLLGADNATPAPVTATTGSVSVDQLPQAMKIIEAELIEVLGPLASLVWNEHVTPTDKPVSASKLRLLIDNLAKEIGDPAKVQRFKDVVWQKIGGTKTAR